MSSFDKISWIFFGAAPAPVALLHPHFIPEPGARTHLFSGSWCFLGRLAATANSWFSHLFLDLVSRRTGNPEESAAIAPQAGLSCSPFGPNLSSNSWLMGLAAEKN